MHCSTLRMLAAFFVCMYSHLLHAQTSIDSTEDHTYGKGVKITKVYAPTQYEKDIKETIREAYYNNSPRKLMAVKQTIKYEDGSTDVSETVFDTEGTGSTTKGEKKDFAGTVVIGKEYRSMRDHIVRGTKWELDESGTKQEYEWDEDDSYWKNKKDFPTYETSTVDDNTYGKGKKITQTMHNSGSIDKMTKEFYRSSSDQLMQQTLTINYKDGSSFTKTTYLKDGKPVKTKSVKKDVFGNILGESEYVPKSDYDETPTSGNKWELDSSNKKVYFKYDAQKKHWVEDESKKEKEPNPDASFEEPNKLALGPAWMHFGDKDFHYGSIGFTANYTHMVSTHVGITADVGIYWHSESDESGGQGYSQDFTQYNFSAGVNWFPLFEKGGSFRFSAHALAGLSDYHTKSSSGSYGSETSSVESFLVNVGVSEECRINQRFGVAMQLNYTPTFFYSSTQNNVRVDLMATFHF